MNINRTCCTTRATRARFTWTIILDRQDIVSLKINFDSLATFLGYCMSFLKKKTRT